MAKKIILLITDDPKTSSAVREALGKKYEVEVVRNVKKAKKSPALIIIDFDLKGDDGLQVFKGLRTSVNTIMLSASGSIPLAVSATKLGVADFLRKPFNKEQFIKTVENNIFQDEILLRGVEGMEWLPLARIKQALRENRDIILLGEQGIPKEKVAEFIHTNSAKSTRRIAYIDMASFRKEALEAHFWATIQELMALPERASIQSEEARCGTIYLENIASLDEHFRLSILKFFKERRGKIDKSVRAIIGIRDRASLKDKDFCWIEIPTLRERKQDIPALITHYLKRFSEKYNKNVKFISAEVLDLLMAYDYPGNYEELEKILEETVLVSESQQLDLSNFPLDFKKLLQESLKKDQPLAPAKKEFERKLYHVLLEKTKGDKAQVARFLDVPKTVLADRLEDVLD